MVIFNNITRNVKLMCLVEYGNRMLFKAKDNNILKEKQTTKQIIEVNEFRFNIFRHTLHLVHDFSQTYNLVPS